MLDTIKTALNKEITQQENTRRVNIAQYETALRSESTATRWNNYTSGKASKEETIEYAYKRIHKYYEKVHAEKLAKIEAAEDPEAERIESISIFTDWRYNRTWGYNPHTETEIITNHRRYKYTGTASGCGYDKYSSAVAESLNQCAELISELIRIKDTYMEEKKNLPYGCGYGVLPYFEGGCGISTIDNILKTIGYKCVTAHESEKTNYLFYEKEN